ncbi:GyrI-like domain-containing protein [Dyadobacter frigoris]|uniref:GyrI-like domain-containing protein n=1 Tax=Dyadobacter frigoris TaxID=2576211 RepID=A0A4U6D0N8_9BACT|nr:GyrI-like domain-containing protein [Dyadobacter frigoris]TKT90760.1 GyrI-like domain-containing protein [Dyadobacter frigoris]GLU52094.1 DNA gyrase inhibitor [Dyadobacter frigoris]
MTTEPKIEFLEAEPYVAIRQKVSMAEIPTVLPPLISEVFIWMGKENIEGNGAPFFRYLSMDEHSNLIVDVGVPTKTKVNGDNRIISRAFPEGDYAVLTFTGDYKNLRQAHISLDEWIIQNGYKDRGVMDDGELVGCRVELYVSDPAAEPEPEKWVTELCILIEKA